MSKLNAKIVDDLEKKMIANLNKPVKVEDKEVVEEKPKKRNKTI